MSSLVIHQTRGSTVEREMFVDAIAVDSGGHRIAVWGDGDRLVVPRSCSKPFHAVAICESFRTCGCELSLERIALTAGSQGGRPDQLAVLMGWLKEFGGAEDDLVCGTYPVTDPATRRSLVREGQMPRQIHHNSAGKHIALLALCNLHGWPRRGYTEFGHPAQRLLWCASAPFFSFAQDGGALEYDGCGCPIPVLALKTLALGAARLARPEEVPEIPHAAAAQVWSAMASRPSFLTRSDDYYVPRIVGACGGNIVMKEGSYGICFLAHRPSGIGIAIKICDGSEAEVPVIAIALLRTLGLLSLEIYGDLKDLAEPEIRGSNGSTYGRVLVSTR